MGADGLYSGVSSERQTRESQLPAIPAVQVALYTRVSTTDQNCEFQLRELQDCAVHQGWQVLEVYQDILSGAQARRPGLSRLMADAASKKFNCLMVWKLDRFGRSLVDCLNNIQTLETYGVRFVAVTQGLDTDQRNPTSRFLLHVLGAAAEFERSLIRERSHAGLLRYRSDFEAGLVGDTVHSRSGRDLPPHRPKKIFNREELVTLRGQGLPLRKIAKRLGLGLGTVTRTLMERANTQQIPRETRLRPSLAEAPAPCREKLVGDADLRASV